MSSIKLYHHQSKALDETAEYNKCAYYHDMGLGKTYTGAEKMIQLGAKVNLVVCQKSKISDWVEHFVDNYEITYNMMVYDCTKWNKSDWLLVKNDPEFRTDWHNQDITVLVINYELVWRRQELLQLRDFTLMLDESSLIQNDTAKRTNFISKLHFTNLILLSGTPTGGKYENLYSQLNMLGYKISEKLFYNMYIIYHWDTDEGFPRRVIDGYKNVDRLKRKMREYGCHFLKTEDVLDLPEQRFIPVKVRVSTEYKRFIKKRIVTVDGVELVGDTILTKLLYARMLCGAYSEAKLDSFRDLLESTADRLIVFYNFNVELDKLREITEDYTDHISVVNGQTKDLTAYETYSDSVTFIQYQAGSMGLNLQFANKIIYFTPPLSSEIYEQSKKRIHRIGQTGTCTYYNMIVKGSVEEKIYKTLEMRKDYTDALFESEV